MSLSDLLAPASTPTTLHVHTAAPRFQKLLQDLESGKQSHQHLQHIHIYMPYIPGYGYNSEKQLAYYTPWTDGTNAQTWINSLFRYLPTSVQTFKLECVSSTNSGRALLDAIQEATDALGRPWTIKVHRLLLWGHRTDKDLVGLTSHFKGVRQLYFDLDGLDGERSTLFEGAFDGMILELLSISMCFEDVFTHEAHMGRGNGEGSEDEEDPGGELEWERTMRACATVAQRFSAELQRAGACRKLVAFKLTLNEWHDGVREDETTSEHFVRAASSLHPLGDRLTVRNLDLTARCSKDSCQSHRVGHALSADLDRIDDGPNFRREPPIDAFPRYPNLIVLRLGEFGPGPEMFRQLGCRQLRELYVTIIEEAEYNELLESLRLPELGQLRKLGVTFGQQPGIDVDRELYDGRWHRAEVKDSLQIVVEECRLRNISVDIEYPSESEEEEDEGEEDEEGGEEDANEDEDEE